MSVLHTIILFAIFCFRVEAKKEFQYQIFLIKINDLLEPVKFIGS